MNKLAIVGFADTKNEAPFNDSSYEIWSLNEFGLDLPRTTRLFQMHGRDIVENNTKDKKHLQKLKEYKNTIYMKRNYKDIPNSVMYPIRKIRGKYGNIFASTFDYMMALAIEEGFTRVELYGIDMSIYSEYQRQRPTAMFFIGYAKGKGIDIWIHPKSGIVTFERYGFEDDPQLEIEKTLELISEKRGYILKCVEEINYTNGMIDCISLLKDQNKDDLLSKLTDNRKALIKLINSIEKEKDGLIYLLSEITNSNVEIKPPDLILHS